MPYVSRYERARGIHATVPSGQEEEASRILALDQAPRIDRLQAHMEKLESQTVDAHSALSGDDRAARPFQVSHSAWYGIAHAADNLHGLRLLTVRGETPKLQVATHPYVAYPLLRAAIENASVALWLLGPARRDLRLTRRFRLALQDARRADEAAKLLGHEAVTLPGRRARLSEILGARPSIALAECERRASFRVIVREGGDGIGIEPDTAEVMWKVLSGLTHGDPWAGLAWTEREEIDVSDVGVVTLRTTSSIANIATMTRYAVKLTESALALYDRRRTAAL